MIKAIFVCKFLNYKVPEERYFYENLIDFEIEIPITPVKGMYIDLGSFIEPIILDSKDDKLINFMNDNDPASTYFLRKIKKVIIIPDLVELHLK